MKIIKKSIWTFSTIFVLLNVVAIFHAYKFTHFTKANLHKTKSAEKLTILEKIKTLLVGINNPRPKNIKLPSTKFETVKIQSNKIIECWFVNVDNLEQTDSSKGTVIVFHGYSGDKSSMLDKSNEFNKLNYNTLLVDFMGSGGSEGNQTTLGYKEAEQVKSAYDYLIDRGHNNIFLFGTSMGAVAILKAINDYHLKPKGIIIECPFGSMYKTTCARFEIMKAPTIPMAGFLVFWGGALNGFWAFGHNPTEYAKKVTCPTLIMYGEQDKNVSRQEIDSIFFNLKGKKKLKTYKTAGHENFLIKHRTDWIKDVGDFIN